jgi:PRMT5 oligomerisation domain
LGDTEVDVYFWRHTDGRKVWYEWCVEGYYILGDEKQDRMDDEVIEWPLKRIKYGMSEIHNLGGKGSNMVIT